MDQYATCGSASGLQACIGMSASTMASAVWDNPRYAWQRNDAHNNFRVRDLQSGQIIELTPEQFRQAIASTPPHQRFIEANYGLTALNWSAGTATLTNGDTNDQDSTARAVSRSLNALAATGGEHQKAQNIQYKEWADAKAGTKPAPRPKLTLKTSPLFAPPKWAGLYWTFESPFAPLKKKFVRWAWSVTRKAA